MLFCNKLVVFSSLNAVLYVLRAVPEISYTQSCAGVFGDGSGCGGGRVAVHHQVRPICPKYPNHPNHPSFILSSHTPQFHTVRIWRPASWFDRTPTRTNLLAILGYTVTRTDDDDGPRVHVEYLSVCNDQEIIEPTEAVELRQSLVAHLSQTDVGKITMLM